MTSKIGSVGNENVDPSAIPTELFEMDTTNKLLKLKDDWIYSDQFRGNTRVVSGTTTLRETDSLILVDVATATTLTLPADLPIGKTISVMRTVNSANAITLAAPSGETINGATTFITHDSEEASVPNTNTVSIMKVSSSAWRWVAGNVKGSSVGKYWEKRHTGYSTFRFTGNIPAVGGFLNITHGLTSSKMRLAGGFFKYGTDVFFFDFLWENGARTAHVSVRATSTLLVIYSDTTLSAALAGSPFEIAVEYEL